MDLGYGQPHGQDDRLNCSENENDVREWPADHPLVDPVHIPPERGPPSVTPSTSAMSGPRAHSVIVTSPDWRTSEAWRRVRHCPRSRSRVGLFGTAATPSLAPSCEQTHSGAGRSLIVPQREGIHAEFGSDLLRPTRPSPQRTEGHSPEPPVRARKQRPSTLTTSMLGSMVIGVRRRSHRECKRS